MKRETKEKISVRTFRFRDILYVIHRGFVRNGGGRRWSKGLRARATLMLCQCAKSQSHSRNSLFPIRLIGTAQHMAVVAPEPVDAEAGYLKKKKKRLDISRFQIE